MSSVVTDVAGVVIGKGTGDLSRGLTISEVLMDGEEPLLPGDCVAEASGEVVETLFDFPLSPLFGLELIAIPFVVVEGNKTFFSLSFSFVLEGLLMLTCGQASSLSASIIEGKPLGLVEAF